jgi:outer membrane lipoprotein SlyB
MNDSARIGLAALLTLATAGCAGRSALESDVYRRGEARTVQVVEHGTVLEVRPVQIEGGTPVIGTIGGGAVGYAAGGSIGGGSGRDVARALGAVVGAVAGGAIEKDLAREGGIEITIELESGDVIAIVQSDKEWFGPGDRVRVLHQGDGAARVVHW